MPLHVAFALLPALLAPIPPGYYDTVDASTPAALRATLHNVIKDHVRFPYTSSGTDTWVILEYADEDPGDSTHILDVYLNDSILKFGGGNGPYNREHTWPYSYGFSNDGSTNYPYTDCHALFLSDDGYNSSRGNDPYGNCGATCVEKPTKKGGLVRETAYLYEDEVTKLEQRAEKERCSKSEVIRRALRAYLKLKTPADM